MLEKNNFQEALLLALYLARKKILINRKDFSDAGEIYSLFENSITEEMIVIKKISLTDIETEPLILSIIQKLGVV